MIVLVTFALSASHTAFASIRMEPVLMVTSQSAATAACLAIDAGVPVQQMSYEKLKQRLVADGQVLQWPPSIAGQVINRSQYDGQFQHQSYITLDDHSAEFTGRWVTSSGQPSLVGASYQHDGNTDRGKKSARFTPNLPAAGEYEVRLLYTPHENRSTNTEVTIHTADGAKIVVQNQRHSVLADGVPRALGIFRFEAGRQGSVVVSNSGANGHVVVDGVQFVPIAIARQQRGGNAADVTDSAPAISVTP